MLTFQRECGILSVLIKKWEPQRLGPLDSRDHEGVNFMATESIAEQYIDQRVSEEVRNELLRCALHEAQARYRHELMDMDERDEVRSRIVRLRRRLGLGQH